MTQTKQQETSQKLSEFLATLTNNKERKIPPLDKWQPATITPFDIVIQDNGDWYHHGTKITRQSLVDLFASVLWADVQGGQKRHFLKTPSDKYEITVIDAPLFINSVDKVIKDGVAWIVFTTTNHDVIIMDKPLYFKEFIKDGVSEYRPYIDTRFHLTARINRNAFYHLVELGELIQDGDDVVLVLQSGGQKYRVAYPSDDLK